MVDINTFVPQMVEDILVLEPFFPDVVPAFPLGILTPLDDGAGLILSGRERLCGVLFQIDVYDTDQQRCEQTAARIAARLIRRGFDRRAGQVFREDRLFRHTLTFSAQIDEQTHYIYRR